MKRPRLPDWAFPATFLIAFWPVWRWYALRMADGSDEKWGLLALGTLAALVLSRRGEWGKGPLPLPAGTALVLLYTLSYPWLPPLGRAVIAVGAVGLFAGAFAFGTPFHTGTWGLLLSALPVTASMQYTLGYPLRLLTGKASALLLKGVGLSVATTGTSMTWMGETVVVDAPCSGVHMLWVGTWLALTLACLYGLPAVKTLSSLALSFLLVTAGNILRASVLFYKEAGIVRWPAWTHEAVGVALFCAVALGILGVTKLLTGGPPCEPRESS